MTDIDLSSISTVLVEDTHWDREDWRNSYSKTTRLVYGKLSSDVQKKLNSEAPVLIKEYTYSTGYSTWTRWDETEFTIICGQFDKEFDSLNALVEWIENETQD